MGGIISFFKTRRGLKILGILVVTLIAIPITVFLVQQQQNLRQAANAPPPTIISSQTTFSSLDGSAKDADGVANGIFTVNGDLTIAKGGSITCNDPVSSPNNNACPMKIVVAGNLNMAEGSSIRSENNNSGGNGGDIQITTGGDIKLEGPSGSTPGAKISSARTTTAGSGNGGDLIITSVGSIDFKSGTVVSAADLGGGKAGDISISSQKPMNLDGLISAGPDNTVVATKLTGFVLESGDTKQRGGKITITCTHGQIPGITVSTDGIIVSQGQDPASDTVTIQGCGLNIYGLVASVSKKSNASSGNSPQVILKSSDNILIDGRDLGASGNRQGKIRADYVIGENHVPNKIDVFTKKNISIFGPSTGEIYVLSSNGGYATDQQGGTITLVSMEGKVEASGLAIQADATPGSGSKGGAIDIKSNLDLDLSGGGLVARGSASGGGVSVRSYSQNILSNTSSLIDVTGGSLSTQGKVSLSACGTIGFPLGVVIPVMPGKTANVCSPSAPSLPPGVTLIVCTEAPTPTETPTLTPTETVTPTLTSTITLTPTLNPTITQTPTLTPTETVTPTLTPTLTPTVTVTQSITPTDTPTVTPTQNVTLTPTETPIPGASSTPKPTIVQPTLAPTGPSTTLINIGIFGILIALIGGILLLGL